LFCQTQNISIRKTLTNMLPYVTIGYKARLLVVHTWSYFLCKSIFFTSSFLFCILTHCICFVSIGSPLIGRTSTTPDRWLCLPPLVCYTVDSPYRSSRSGAPVKIIWFVSIMLWGGQEGRIYTDEDEIIQCWIVRFEVIQKYSITYHLYWLLLIVGYDILLVFYVLLFVILCIIICYFMYCYLLFYVLLFVILCIVICFFMYCYWLFYVLLFYVLFFRILFIVIFFQY